MNFRTHASAFSFLNMPICHAGCGHAERKQNGRETSRTVGKQRTPRHRGGGVISTTLKGCLCSLPSRSRSLSRPSLFFLHTTAKRGCACRPKQQSSKGRLASRFIRHRSCSNDASCSIWEYHHITERAADRARLPCGTRRRWTRPWPWGRTLLARSLDSWWCLRIRPFARRSFPARPMNRGCVVWLGYNYNYNAAANGR